ncbi:general substrate transporter [Meyerozyma guilliermondii]
MNQTTRPSAQVATMPLPMVDKIPRMSSVVLPPVSNLTVFDSPSKLTEQNLQQNLLNLSRAATFASVNATASPMRATNAALTGSANSGRSDSFASSASSPYSNEPSSAPTSPALPSSPKMAIIDSTGHTKRRQRLGPSCDSCRSRKVKCDADILVLAKTPQEMNFAHMKVSSTQINNLFNNNTPIKLDDDSFIIVANEKVIKFTPCKSCSAKGLPCSFSKGFTKEDIILNSKKSESTTPLKCRTSVSKVTKPRIPEAVSPVAANLAVSVAGGAGVLASAGTSSRKSSCSLCRRRKVKCVYNASANKCDGCLKKSTNCSYDI